MTKSRNDQTVTSEQYWEILHRSAERFGSFYYDGQKYIIVTEPYADGTSDSPYCTAKAVKADSVFSGHVGNCPEPQYTVNWSTTSERMSAGCWDSTCDWDNPDEVVQDDPIELRLFHAF